MDFVMAFFFHFLLSYFFHYIFSISGFTYLEPSYILQDPPPRIYWPWASVLTPPLFFLSYYVLLWAFQMVLVLKNPPAVQETWVRSLDWEDLLEKGMTTDSSILAWRISWTEEPDGLQSIVSQSWTRLKGLNTYSVCSSFSHLIHHFWGARACHKACGILVSRPGIKPEFPSLEAQSLNHWTTREVPNTLDYSQICSYSWDFTPNLQILTFDFLQNLSTCMYVIKAS